MNSEQLRRLTQFIENPSLGAVTYQAHVLVNEIRQIHDEEFPHQACRIRNVCLAIADYIRDELWALLETEDSDLSNERFARMSKLGEAVQDLYSYVRYLKASSPSQSPPPLQAALSHLTDLFFPRNTCGEAICLVRPQWKYNLTYVPFNSYLSNIVSPAALDPAGGLSISDPSDIIPALWKRWTGQLSESDKQQFAHSMEPFPDHMAVLSFAGLDTNDTLLYPLLAHELGHFIDFSHTPTLHQSIPYQRVTDEQIAGILVDAGRSADPESIKEVKTLIDHKIFLCFRELLADLLAARMLGFGFFCAQSEFLKTMEDWDQPNIVSDGYPSMRYRLSVVYDLLTSDKYVGNLQSFLQTNDNQESRDLQVFLRLWRERLQDHRRKAIPHRQEDTWSQVWNRIDELVGNIVNDSLDALHQKAKGVVPDIKCARLDSTFFSRIRRLRCDLPPSLTREKESSFSEILSSAWAYQVLFGEESERGKPTLKKKVEEYEKTCRLILKAIELLPTSGTVSERSEGESVKTEIEEAELAVRKGVLSGPHLKARIQDLPISHPLHLDVCPFHPDAICGASLDVHLGNWFVVFRRVKLESVNVERDEKLLRTRGREEVFVPTGRKFLLHPGDLVLGATLEFFALPNDLMAFVEGRSRLGRIGLIVSTASQVAPGFHGVIVLEMANAGTVPLEVRPGDRIGQLVFQTMSDSVPSEYAYHGKFHCQIKP